MLLDTSFPFPLLLDLEGFLEVGPAKIVAPLFFQPGGFDLKISPSVFAFQLAVAFTVKTFFPFFLNLSFSFF